MIGPGGASSSSSTTQQSSSTTDEQQRQMNELIAQCQAITFDDSQTSYLIESMKSADLAWQYFGVIGLRKVLCNEKSPPIDHILDSGVVPKLIEIMRTSKELEIQLDAAWSLTNLCSGTSEQTERVINCGVIPGFLSAFQSENQARIDQSIWGLGNIAGDSTEFRDLVIKEGGVEAIANFLENVSTVNSKIHGVWALSNCCRGKPEPTFHSIARAIPVFCKFLKSENDQEVLIDSAWGLLWNSERAEAIQAIINTDVIPAIVGHLSSIHPRLVTPCLRICGNVISGHDEQADVVLKEKDFFPALLKLASHETEIMRKETFWTISNITAGQPIQSEGIMGNPAFVERIIDTAKNDIQEVQIEAIYALSNSTTTGTPAQIIRLLNNGVFKCLLELLDEVSDARMLNELLEGIENCLKWGKQLNLVDESGANRFVMALEEQGGIGKIENLRTHPSNEVHERAIRILQNYFETE